MLLLLRILVVALLVFAVTRPTLPAADYSLSARELLTAAAVLLFPVAVTAAVDVGADPRGYAIALAIAASASFLTPIGYQTNTMVYGAGGYRFTDYPRLGAPLTAIVIISVITLVTSLHLT